MLIAPLNMPSWNIGPTAGAGRFAASRRAALAESVQKVDAPSGEDAAATLLAHGGGGGAEDGAAQEKTASNARAGIYFVYRPVQENGRRGAKRAAQNTDSDWSFLLDQRI